MFLKTVVILKTSTWESLKYGKLTYVFLFISWQDNNNGILLLHKLGVAGAGSELNKPCDSDRIDQDPTSS